MPSPPHIMTGIMSEFYSPGMWGQKLQIISLKLSTKSLWLRSITNQFATHCGQEWLYLTLCGWQGFLPQPTTSQIKGQQCW